MGLYSHDGSYFVTPTEDLLTDGGDGPNRRLRVDVGQTGFFAGREFRTFYEFSSSFVIQVVAPVNTILFEISVALTSGEVRVESVTGGTPGGMFSTPLPVFARNTMTERPFPYYTPQVTAAVGGTHTGGTVLDVFKNKTADNANFAAGVGSGSSDERGVGPATYYIRVTVTGTTAGILKFRWEERP
jgi:hypothetical protein